MGKYRMYIDVAQANDYTKGEIDGIVRTIVKDSGNVQPWFEMNDDADPMKFMDVTPDQLSAIVNTVERVRPNVIRRIEFE